MGPITSVFLPETKLVYRVGGNIVNSTRTIGFINMTGTTPMTFDLYDSDNNIIATIVVNEAIVTYGE